MFLVLLNLIVNRLAHSWSIVYQHHLDTVAPALILSRLTQDD